MKFENRKAQKKILLRLLGAALLLLFVLKTALDGFSGYLWRCQDRQKLSGFL